MKKKWFWPVIVTSFILLLLLILGLYYAVKAYQKSNVLDIDERIRTHIAVLDGEVKQNLGFYYIKGTLKEPVLMHVKLGDFVQKGDPLFTYVDSSLADKESELELKLDNRRINKEQIEGQIASYESRLQDASDSAAATIEGQISWLEAELSKAENNIAILEKQRDKVSRQLDGLTITAGADGEVVDVDDEQVQAFTQKAQNKPVLTVSFDDIHIEGLASRYYVQFLEPNLKLKATTPDVPEAIFEGVLESVQNTRESRLESGIIEPVTVEIPTTEAPNKSEAQRIEFPYTAVLNKTNQLYDGDEMTVKVQLSYKNHVWLPEKFVLKETKRKDKAGKKITPVTRYYVKKIYGDRTKREEVKVKKRIGKQYLVTEGLSSVDTIEAFKK